MGGGLINIVSYASNDLYLTGSPQITFYKMVYRRYTNFSMESVSLNFDDDIIFDEESEIVPPRIGDLIHKGYLHINIPSFNVTKEDVGIDLNDYDFIYADQGVTLDYENVKNVYMEIMTDIYTIVFKAKNASNVSYTGLLTDVREYVDGDDRLKLIQDYDNLLESTSKDFMNRGLISPSILDYTRSDLWYIITNIDATKLFNDAAGLIDTSQIDPESQEYTLAINNNMKCSILDQLTIAIKVCEDVQYFYFNRYQQFIRESQNDVNVNIKSAWVRNLGYSIIDYVDVYIGGRRMDRHTGIWMNIWYQLTYNQSQIRTHNEMIGNVSKLTNFDNEPKPDYDIYIPLSFWFNKYNGLSFPLVAMQYNDIRFNVRFKKLEQVYYIERLYRGIVNGSERILTADLINFLTNRSENRGSITVTDIEIIEGVSLRDIWDSKGINIYGEMLLDYVYLDSSERKRFARSGHEYLIERIQDNYFDNIENTDFSIQLDFTNPSKEIVWCFNKDVYINNVNGWNECQWHNHTIDRTKKINPINTCKIDFNNYVRMIRQIGTYFDVYQPLTYHRTTPDRGINMLSFCLDPLQQQPTGSANFSRLTNVMLFSELNNKLFYHTDEELYPHDTNINFTITINDQLDFINNINMNILNNRLMELENRNLNTELNNELNQLNELMQILKNMEDGTENKINTELYRLIPFNNTATCYIFSLSINILRIIGGYGALAYSGNK